MALATRFLFVGERPSKKAHRIGATWQNGRLSAKNLREAISAVGLDPDEQEYLNLWSHPEPDAERDQEQEAVSLAWVRSYVRAGCTVVGMGHLVCKVLSRECIPYRMMVHPAARGAIRKTERYQAHVRDVLAFDAVGYTPEGKEYSTMAKTNQRQERKAMPVTVPPAQDQQRSTGGSVNQMVGASGRSKNLPSPSGGVGPPKPVTDGSTKVKGR